MSQRVAPDRDPAAAARAVLPDFVMQAARVVAHVNIVSPLLVDRVRGGPYQVRGTPVGKFRHVSGPAVGAFNQHHDVVCVV